MSNVLTMEKKQKKSAGEKVDNFLTRNRTAIIAVFLVAVLAAVGVGLYAGITQSGYKKGLAAIDSIEYTFTKDIASADAPALVERQNAAMKALEPYLAKKDIVGVRANMLAAEIAYEKKDFSTSLGYWLAAVDSQKNTYVQPVCYFNAASCSEELNNNEDAAKYYELAANSKEFLLSSHALFNFARVKEASGDNSAAATAYKKLVDEYPYDNWASLAQSRLISLKADGFIE